MVNTILYYVRFPDGSVKSYLENLIAEHIPTLVDQDGYHSQMPEGVLDHVKDGRAVEEENWWIVSERGRRYMRKTAVGWKFRVKWKDGTITWSPLKDLRESNPVDIAVYATARGIHDEPTFAW